MTLTLPDPMVVAPFKVPPRESEHRKAWLRRHVWPLRVVPMLAEHVSLWDSHVQPTIERIELERLTGLRSGEAPRADAYWPFRWSQVWQMFSVAPRMLVRSGGQLSASQPQLWAVEVDTPAGVRPVGLLLGLSNYPLPTAAVPHQQALLGPSRRSASLFAWLLTTAPSDVLQRWEVAPNLQLGRVLLDTAVQGSLAAKHFGQVLLHADPYGGDGLLAFYRDCGMGLMSLV